jgi:AcrR family transcriptional regulator
VTKRTATKRQAQAAATRGHLLQAARAVFAESGYSGATVAAITERARTAHGTFYLYFRNKDEAFMHVVEEVMFEVHDEVLAIDVDPERDLREILDEALHRFFSGFAKNRGIWRTLLEGALTTPELADRWATISAGFHRRVAALLAELERAGLIRPVDSPSVAVAIASIGEWMAISTLVAPPGSSPEEGERRFDALVDIWHHTLAPASTVVD